MRLFHRTRRANAAAILREGFRNGRDSYMLDGVELEGVFFSDRPLGPNEGAFGDVVLAVDLELSEAEISQAELQESGKPYREFVLRAARVNRSGSAAVFEVDGDEADDASLPPHGRWNPCE